MSAAVLWLWCYVRWHQLKAATGRLRTRVLAGLWPCGMCYGTGHRQATHLHHDGRSCCSVACSPAERIELPCPLCDGTGSSRRPR